LFLNICEPLKAVTLQPHHGLKLTRFF